MQYTVKIKASNVAATCVFYDALDDHYRTYYHYYMYITDIAPIHIKGCMRAASTWRPWVSGLVGHFVQTWPASELLSHSAVLRL